MELTIEKMSHIVHGVFFSLLLAIAATIWQSNERSHKNQILIQVAREDISIIKGKLDGCGAVK